MQNNENQITKVLYNQVSFVIAITGVILSIFFWITNPQNAVQAQVDILQQDVEHNKIEYKAEEVFQSQTLIEIKNKIEKIEADQQELIKAVARLEVKIK